MNKVYQAYKKMIGADNLFYRTVENAQLTGEPASNLIKDAILSGKPLMVSRFGATELNCILNYYFIHQSVLGNIKNVLTGIPYFLSFKQGILHNMNVLSGFFPATVKNAERYCELSIKDLADIDILGSWLKQEQFLYKYFNPDHTRIRLGDITALKHEHPWSAALEGKKVLVVHPFEDTIKSQYKKRALLFKNSEMLPSFELRTLKAVQSLSGSGTRFQNWFEALDVMKEQIDAIDFDIALLGCGAYGMPLAAHIKRRGKQAIHIGGETQVLFGIKGKRWEAPSYNYQEKFYNEHWVRPAENEIPAEANKVEGGCYW